MSKTKKDEIKESRYSKKQFIQSDIYPATDRDILKIVLKDNEKYTKEEVNSQLETFKRKEVK